MHEMALVRNLVDATMQHANDAQANRVEAVNLAIGYGRDIQDALFYELFEHLSKGTIVEGAELNVRRIPIMSRYGDCGQIYHVDYHNECTWRCHRCGSRDYVPHSGMEFRIESIEVA